QLARWDTLSPGERRRWQIGAALSAEPDVLLLDEPTNHVDASCRALLVSALRRFDGVGLVISHDRALLDELTTATIRVHAGTARLYPGCYSAAKQTWEADEQRARELRGEAQRQVRHAAKQLAEARRDQQQADANRSASRRKKGPKDHDAVTLGASTRIAWAEARHGRTVEVARRRVERATAAIPDAPHARELGRSVFVGYERAPRRWLFELAAPVIPPVLRDVKVAVGQRDRIRIAGPNGAGKTTLLRALLASHTLPADRVLYLPQELDEDLRGELRALPPELRGRTLSLVAALGVDPDRLLASDAPSPGELRKLALALGLGRHAWCVVLDEPTNHLDLPSIERLETALAAFPGSIVLVTHDDELAARCTEITWQIEDGRIH
ncbi:MAG TPA: ATP-binding cassette domain-containing protein, partial [Kofleriaceae bacterium]|nr:ATP-binding cassette domain-containing protein [Kofleriaceae bacterium]